MPSLKKNSDVDELEVREPEVRITRGMYGRLIYRRVFQVFAFAVAAGIILYLCFAATWVRIVPTISGAGFVPVKNVTYEGGVLPEGSQVLVDRVNPQGTQVQHRLKQSFVPSSFAAKVEVVGGPYGELKWVEPSILTVDGEPVGAPLYADDEGNLPFDERDPFLKNQYVGVCVSGACTPGEAFIFDRDQVYGSLLVKE